MSRDLNCLYEALRFSMLISQLPKYLPKFDGSGAAAFVTEMRESRDITLVILPLFRGLVIIHLGWMMKCRTSCSLTYTSGPNICMSIWWALSTSLRIRMDLPKHLTISTWCTSFVSHSHGPHSIFFKHDAGCLSMWNTLLIGQCHEVVTSLQNHLIIIRSGVWFPSSGILPDCQIGPFFIYLSFISRAHRYVLFWMDGWWNEWIDGWKWLWGISMEMLKY